jgi:hypothetical protein
MAEILHKDLLGDDIHELRVTVGSSAPSSVPLFVGQGYYDIVGKKFYVAQGTSLITDWATTPIPPFLVFADTRTITWTSNQVGEEVTYQANVDEAELILTAANITDFGTAVLTLPEIISLLADQHTRLIMRTGAEPGGWAPVVQDGLELDPAAQKIRLSQNLSEFGNPQFDEVTLVTRSTTPLLTLSPNGVSTTASAFLDATKGVVVRGGAGSTSSFTLQNEAGTDVIKNPVSSTNLIVPSLAAGAGAPGVVHADVDGLLSTSKLVDADVDAAAAIAGTKVVPDFGSQNITTTGSVLVDTIESNTDDIGILTGNTNKNISIGTGIGFNTITLGGANSTVNISGATYTTPVEYVSEDKNIIVNFNASGQDSQDSGIYVQEEYAGPLIEITDAVWQSGNTVRYVVDPLGAGVDGLIAGEFIRVVGFVNSQNNGTFKVLTVDPAYIDVVNPKRTNSTLDETGVVGATAARLLVNGYIHVGSTRSSWEVRAPAHLGIIELKPQPTAKTLLITSESVNNVTVKFNTDLTIDQDLQKTASVEFGGMKISTLSTGLVHSDSVGTLTSSLLVDADVDGAAAIAGTKISPDFGNQNVTTTGTASFASVNVTDGEAPGGSVLSKSAVYGVQVRGIAGTSAQFRFLSDLGTPIADFEDDGQVTLHHLATTGVVKATAGILSSGLLVNADVDAAAAIAGTKIDPDFGSQNVVTTGSVTSSSLRLTGLGTGIVHSDGSGNLSSSGIIDADVDAAAAIAGTKIDPDFGSQNVVTSGDVSGGSLTTTGLASLGGGQKVKLSTLITTNYSATTSDYILQVDSTSGALTIDLPSAATAGTGTVIIIKDASGAAEANNIIVAPNGMDTVDGGTYTITDTYASVTFVSNGVDKWLAI